MPRRGGWRGVGCCYLLARRVIAATAARGVARLAGAVGWCVAHWFSPSSRIQGEQQRKSDATNKPQTLHNPSLYTKTCLQIQIVHLLLEDPQAVVEDGHIEVAANAAALLLQRRRNLAFGKSFYRFLALAQRTKYLSKSKQPMALQKRKGLHYADLSLLKLLRPAFMLEIFHLMRLKAIFSIFSTA